MADSVAMKKLVENSVKLQKLSISLVESNKELIKRLDNLVNLFEVAAKNMGSVNQEEVGKLNNQISKLTQENKQLARGLLLMENRQKLGGSSQQRLQGKPIPKL